MIAVGYYLCFVKVEVTKLLPEKVLSY